MWRSGDNQDHQYWWLARGFELEINNFRVGSKVVTLWIVAFLLSVFIQGLETGQLYLKCYTLVKG